MRKTLREVRSQEKILMYGPPKAGKTYAVCSMMKACIDGGNQVFYINTDNGLKSTFMEFFGDEAERYIDKVIYYHVENVDEVATITEDIKKSYSQNDLVVIDMLSDIHLMAQFKMLEKLVQQCEVVEYISDASIDNTKFGMLNSQNWIYAKKIDALVSYGLVVWLNCTVVGITQAQSIEHDKIHKNEKVLDKFEMVGYKPKGFFDYLHRFNTILYLGEFIKDNDISKFFIILGDRGNQNLYKRFNFESNFWEKYKEYRGVQR